jgi:hypothetical protein
MSFVIVSIESQNQKEEEKEKRQPKERLKILDGGKLVAREKRQGRGRGKRYQEKNPFCVALSFLVCSFLPLPAHIGSIMILFSLALSVNVTLLRIWNFSPP